MSPDHPVITKTSIRKSKKISPGQLLQIYRTQTGLTQSQLAQTIGLKSLRMIQYWEAGNSLPKADNLKRLVESFISHHAFNEGAEREEIDQLWETVRVANETEPSSRGGFYPELDKSWLEKLLVASLLPQSGATSPVISLPHPELPGNLPLSPNRFIGRKQELDKVSTLLGEAQTGLLTLVGPGGAGKTRLALEVARHLQLNASEYFPDGVWLVELASISEPQLIPQLVATVLWSQRQTEGNLLSGLVNYLRDKRLLVILDNCEHLIAECATFAGTLLANCPHLKILATSREGLNLSGELVWPVEGLPLTASSNSGQLKEKGLAESEAVTLFVTRAQAVQPTFSLTEANTTSVIQLCRQLDGLPLALELAAARVKGLGIEQIVTRLQASFQILSGGSRTSAPRHQTIHSLIDWSYELLGPKEQLLLPRLTVFQGNFSLEAAEAVVLGGAYETQLEAKEILDLLLQLVNKSLVVAEHNDTHLEVRYRLLEMVRQHGLEKLNSQENSEFFRWQHSLYYLSLAQKAEPEYKGANQAEWLSRLEREHDNLRAALVWTLDNSPTTIPAVLATQTGAEMALQLSGTLWRFWFMRGYYSEGREWLEKALALTGEGVVGREREIKTARAKVLRGAGVLANAQNDFSRGQTYLEASLALYKELDFKYEAANLLNDIGVVSWTQSDYTSTASLWSESLALMREIGHSYGIANQLNNLGAVFMHQGQYKQAMELYKESAQLYRQLKDDYGLASNLENQGEIYRNLGKLEQASVLTEESLKLFRKLGNKQGIASSLNYLATIALGLGDYERAKSWAEESLALTQELGDAYLRSYVLHNLAGIAQGQGELEKAVGFFKDSLSLRLQVGDKTGLIESLESLADLAAALGDWPSFLRLSGATETLREKLGVSLKPGKQTGSEKALEKASYYLGIVACEEARREGRSFSLEEATSYALNSQFEAFLSTSNQALGTTIRLDNAKKSDLTTREIEVLDLLAQGLSNPQIAEKLVISAHTVNRHLTNIYNKLDLTSRTEAVRYALQNSGNFQIK